MLKKAQVAETIKQLLSDELDKPLESFSPEQRFKEDLDVDSLDTVEFIMSLEEKFEIEIPDVDAEELKTVGDVIAYIENKMPE